MQPTVRIITTTNEAGEVLDQRRQYTFATDDERGLPSYTDTLDVLGEWKGAPVKKLDAEMTERYERVAGLILDPPEPEKAEPVDPAAAGEALDLAAAALQQAQDAIAALRAPADSEG